jgi:hypothetical protein
LLYLSKVAIIHQPRQPAWGLRRPKCAEACSVGATRPRRYNFPERADRRRRERNIMKYVCDAPAGCTWFGMETHAEAEEESRLMRHAVEKYFKRDEERARETYRPADASSIERDIGLKAHIARTMPLYLTLRADDGEPLATAMLPPEGRSQPNFRVIIVGPKNSDPYDDHAEAITRLGAHFGLALPRESCFPYAGRP